MIALLVLSGFYLGVAVVIGGAWVIDTYHGWCYRRRNLQELRERPTVPFTPHKFEIWYEEREWFAHAFDRHGVHINAYASAEHPMDAVRYLIEELREREDGDE